MFLIAHRNNSQKLRDVQLQKRSGGGKHLLLSGQKNVRLDHMVNDVTYS